MVGVEGGPKLENRKSWEISFGPVTGSEHLGIWTKYVPQDSQRRTHNPHEVDIIDIW